MNIAESMSLLVETLVDTTIFAFAELIQNIQDNPVSFIATALLALTAYIILNIYKSRVVKKTVSRKFEIVIYILSPFVFILFTYYAVQSDKGNPLYILLNYLGFYWLSSALMKVPSKYLSIKTRLYYVPAMFFIMIALVIAVYIDVTMIYTGVYKKGLQTLFDIAQGTSKFFMVLGFFIYIKGVLPKGLHALKEAYPKAGFLTGAARFFILSYIIIAALWVFDIIALDFRAVMALALLGMMLAFLSYLIHKIQNVSEYLYTKESYTELEWTLIKKHVTRLVLVVFIYVYYVLMYSALNMGGVIERLKVIYLFETKVFSLSVLGLLSALVLFMLLKSALYLFTKYLRVMLSDREFTDDTDSLEIIVYNIGLLLVIMATMLQMGITWQIVVPLAGALGIGIGFGLQTVINNYICGFILLFSKKVRIGDFVELPGTAGNIVGVNSSTVFGRVMSIDMFATTVQTYDNIEIMVPNSVFISETIINYTRSDKYIRVRVPVGISYGSDIDLAQKLMFEAIDSCEYVIKHRKSDVWFMAYGESSLDFMVLFWLDMSEGFQITSVKNVFLTSLWHKFKEHGIEIPFPQQDVWFRNELKVDSKDSKEND